MNFDKLFLVAVGTALLFTSLAKTLRDLYYKTIEGKLGALMSFCVSIIGGVILFIFVSIFTDNQKWHVLAACVGSWSGVMSIDLITSFIHEKFNLKTNQKDERQNED